VGTTRTCGPRCHNAKEPECDCWCAGLFHGATGKAAREAFAKEYGEEPMALDEENLFWPKAIAAALAASTPNPCKPSELVVGEGFAMYIPCPHCGVIHRPKKTNSQ
jgi:hypothetical protein